MQKLSTTDEVIDALGGNIPVAALTSATNKAVSNWRSYGTFPANTYVALTRALRAAKKTAPDSLWRMKSSEGRAA
jgi:hypothetical protein